MQVTLTIEDELLAKAGAYTGIHTVEELVYQGIKNLIECEAVRRLARLGSTEPDLVFAAAVTPAAKVTNPPGI